MNNFISLLSLPTITHWFQQTVTVYLLCRKHWPQGRKGCKYEPEWSVPSGSPCWQTDTDIKTPYKTLMTCPDAVLQEFGGELCSFCWLLMFSNGEKGQLWWCQHFTLCLQPGEKHRTELLLSPLAPLLVPNCKKKDDFVSISSWSHAKAALCFPCPYLHCVMHGQISELWGSAWSHRNRPFSHHFQPCVGDMEPLGSPAACFPTDD